MSAIELTSNDVICLRTKQTRSHEGNLRYQALVRDHREMYQGTNLRDEKCKIIRTILQHVQQQGGRFVKPDGRQGWVQVDDSTAYEKVSHALRSGKGSSVGKSARKSRKASKKAPKEQMQPTAPVSPPTPTTTFEEETAIATPESLDDASDTSSLDMDSIFERQVQIFEHLRVEPDQEFPEDTDLEGLLEQVFLVDDSASTRSSVTSTASSCTWEHHGEEIDEEEHNFCLEDEDSICWEPLDHCSNDNEDSAVLDQLLEVAELEQLLA